MDGCTFSNVPVAKKWSVESLCCQNAQLQSINGVLIGISDSLFFLNLISFPADSARIQDYNKDFVKQI